MSITFLISDLKSSGGTQRMLCLLCNILIEEFEINILVSRKGESFFNLDSRVKIVYLQNKKLSHFYRNLKIYNVLKNSKAKYYINLDSNSLLLNSLFIPRFTKVILWEHFSLSTNFKKLLFTISRHYSVFRCNKLVLLSNDEIQAWGAYNYLSKRKSKLIYNPVSANVKNIYKFNKRHFKTFLAVGNNIEVKGFDILLKAWQLAKTEWKLKIVGLDEYQISKLSLLIKERNLQNIELYSKVKNIDYFYKSSSVFLLPSRKEATPLVLIESQAYGLPGVVFNHLPSVLELVDDSSLIVNFNDQEQAFSDAIKLIANDSYLYERLHMAALKNVEKFSLENFKQNWLKILD